MNEFSFQDKRFWTLKGSDKPKKTTIFFSSFFWKGFSRISFRVNFCKSLKRKNESTGLENYLNQRLFWSWWFSPSLIRFFEFSSKTSKRVFRFKLSLRSSSQTVERILESFYSRPCIDFYLNYSIVTRVFYFQKILLFYFSRISITNLAIEHVSQSVPNEVLLKCSIL